MDVIRGIEISSNVVIELWNHYSSRSIATMWLRGWMGRDR
jgi:hypothetical protein